MNIILRAKKGMWLTDGVTYAKTVDLAEGATIDRYTEITDEEYASVAFGNEADAEQGFASEENTNSVLASETREQSTNGALVIKEKESDE